MAWDEGQTLQARFENACQTGGELHRHWRLGESYGGFVAALRKRSAVVVKAIASHFREHMKDVAGDRWKVCGWVAMAVDGTRQETPHTLANEEGLGCAGREKSAPQVFLTSIWHIGLGLPWDFRNGPGTDSERRHLLDMLADLPPLALIVADAGFVGYDLCRAIIAAGHSFLLRVGSNVTLLTKLGYHWELHDDTVYLWPLQFRNQPPLTLRLIKAHDGKRTMHLLTNVLNKNLLSDKDAYTLYRMRWGIEVGYRSYKQTLDRKTLLSRTPATCLLESQWIMLGLWLLGLMCVKRQLEQGGDPRRWSTAKARNAVRWAMRPSLRRFQLHRSRLSDHFSQAIHDNYSRTGSKAARNYPRKKREKPPGAPKIKTAQPKEVELAKQFPCDPPLAA